MWLNSLVILFLTQMLKLLNYIKLTKNVLLNLKKLLPKYIISFPIRKNELFKAIIKNQSNLKKITKVIHPEVRIKMNKFLMKNRNKKIVVLDISLLLENKN